MSWHTATRVSEKKGVTVDGMTIFALVYIAGVVVMTVVMRRRRGIRHHRRIPIFGEGGVGPIWFAKAVIFSMFWPVTLVVWAVAKSVRAQGRPSQP